MDFYDNEHLSGIDGEGESVWEIWRGEQWTSSRNRCTLLVGWLFLCFHLISVIFLFVYPTRWPLHSIYFSLVIDFDGMFVQKFESFVAGRGLRHRCRCC